MKHLLLLSLPALGLIACGGTASPDGGRPLLPTGVTVRFPAAPAQAYLSLMNDAGTSVYQISVPTGATWVEVDPTVWSAQSAQAQPIESLLPAGAGAAPAGTKVLLLNWVMWQDRNTNGKLDTGERLNLMTHDRAAYSSAAVKTTFQTLTPDMVQTWNLRSGWSRAEHHVYRPVGTATHQRHLMSADVQIYTLHVETPLTSQ